MELLLPFAVFSWVWMIAVVAVAANARGRNWFGWLLVAILVSPFLAGLLLLALPCQDVTLVRISHTTDAQRNG